MDLFLQSNGTYSEAAVELQLWIHKYKHADAPDYNIAGNALSGTPIKACQRAAATAAAATAAAAVAAHM